MKIDFTGTIDGVAFEGGTAENIDFVLGRGSFIPGFEAGLQAVAAGEEREVEGTFPTNYSREDLAGKTARFAVKVKEVARPDPLKIDDELAKKASMPRISNRLKTSVKASIERDFAGVASRQKLKRKLLPTPLPTNTPSNCRQPMLEQEFAGIWRQLEADMKSANKTFADDNTTEEAARADYRKIAERRVRLGLVLADMGQKANITVSDDELTQALVARARQFPGQEREVWEFYKKNPQAMAELRAPVFEEKTVDHLLGQIKVEEKAVTREELFADVEEGEPSEAAS